MIPQAYITEWSSVAPWPANEQIEQDLIISRVLCDIYRDKFLAERLAFRGGTALHKLYLSPAMRYSEDIDLVQIPSEPIKPTIQALRERLNYMGDANVQQKRDNNTLIFKIAAESVTPITIRLKIEINCREHFSVLGYKTFPFEVNSSWYSAQCDIKTFELEELLGTKMRALYQRRKGRDLFDLYASLLLHPDIDVVKIIKCYRRYMDFSSGSSPTKKQYLLNMVHKIDHPEFYGDTKGLLRPEINYDHRLAWKQVREQLIERI
jgi:predicted nucleotidyltransferase component of viral defense system